MAEALKPWINLPENTDFSIYNLPFGIFSTGSSKYRVGIAIGDQIIDLAKAHQTDIFDGLNIPAEVFENEYLNDFIGLGKLVTTEVRERVQNALCVEGSPLQNNPTIFVDQSSAIMHMPVRVGDYTDFYSSIEHATNIGKMFRGPENALMPNWKHLPVGYHGRASSIIISGQDIHRPKGQLKPEDSNPIYAPTRRLDIELEMAFIVGKSTPLGSSISTTEAKDHIFGMVLFNDWSARDIQKWEYVPLGPFLGKSFASSISPWVVTLEALQPFAVESPKQDPEVLSYLQYDGKHNYDIALEVDLIPNNEEQATTITRTNYKYMYWNMAQQLAHHTVNGCNVNIGDMMASGTISGTDPGSFGSLLELTKGKEPITLNGGQERVFLEDGDRITMRGHASKDGKRVGFGEVTAKILPAK